jgi:hypothetical protein
LSAVLHTRAHRVSVAAAGVILAGVLTTGCGAVSDNDVVASVDDATLHRDLFADLVADREAAAGLPADAQSDADLARTDGDTARGITGQFITAELARSDLDAFGIAVPPIDSSLTGAPRFDAEYQAIGQAWVGAPHELIADDPLRDWYNQGPQETGWACVSHILVEDEAQARAVLDRLDGGEEFGAVAADVSLDTGSAAQGGSLGGCMPVANFQEQYDPDFVDAALAAEVGVPTQPVETQFGQHVIKIVPFDELSDNDVLAARLIALGDWHDVETDPEIGVWSFPNVTALG